MSWPGGFPDFSRQPTGWLLDLVRFAPGGCCEHRSFSQEQSSPPDLNVLAIPQGYPRIKKSTSHRNAILPHHGVFFLLFPHRFPIYHSSVDLRQSLSSRNVLLNRRRRLPLPRRATRTPARTLGLLRHACFAVQLLVGIDHVGFLGRHFLAVDHAETGCCWDVQGALGGEGGSGTAGHARCREDAGRGYQILLFA